MTLPLPDTGTESGSGGQSPLALFLLLGGLLALVGLGHQTRRRMS